MKTPKTNKLCLPPEVLKTISLTIGLTLLFASWLNASDDNDNKLIEEYVNSIGKDCRC